MSGMIKRVPTISDLSRLYFELEKKGADCVGEKKGWTYRPKNREELFCLACDLSRYDPRLITILARYLSAHGNELNPASVRSHYPVMKTPQTVAVIAEFVLHHGSVGEEMRYFLEYLQGGLQAVPLQYYFHHLYLPGGVLGERAVSTPLAEYKRWGFLAREAPVFDDESRRVVGRLDEASRRNLLNDLLEQKRVIRMADYLAECRWAVSRQQALADLKSTSGLVKEGKGRGARWSLGPG